MSETVIPLRSRGRPTFEQSDRPAADRFLQACSHIAVSKTPKAPLWRQLSEQLAAVILDGAIEPHSRIPSEEALAELFGVSRPVVRKAMQSLAARALIVTLHRKGTFVGSSPMETDFITTNVSLYDDMVAKGRRVRSEAFEFLRTSPDEQERDALQLRRDGSVVRIGRVFWMDGKPITYTRMSLHGEKVPGLEALDIEDRSVLGLLRERYGLKLRRAERWFQAALPPANVAAAMSITPQTPVIWIESIAYGADNTPIEYYRAYYNSETARIHLSILD